MKTSSVIFTALAMALQGGISAPAFAQNPAPVMVAEQGSAWSLVWSDEFDGTSIDMDKWSFETNCWGGGNDERQCYTDRKKNARVKDGVLHITARRERYTGHALPQSQWKTKKDAKKSATLPYTSARLRTIGKGDWRYGRFEIRAKLPMGQGTWPAIWMLPSDNHYGAWAASGEIDIMEAVNLGTPCEACEGGLENRVLGTLHYGDVWPDNKHSGSDTEVAGAGTDFHTYAIEWTAGKIAWFVDGRLYAEQTEADWHSDADKAKGRPYAPFDQRFHLLLNLAIGGGLPEERNAGGVSPKGFPKTMEVDFVRVYECAGDPDSAIACTQ